MMAELDEVLAAALRDLAAEAPPLPPLSPKARGRIRARRSAAIVASIMVVAGMSAGAVVGVQALTRAAPPQASPRQLTTAYVLSGSGTVTPIRTATNKALPRIKLGKGRRPCAIAITPDGKTAYVASYGPGPGFSGTVTPIRTATNTALRPVRVGTDPRAIAITPDSNTAYVITFGSVARCPDRVTPIRTATNMALPPVHVGGCPIAIAITPDSKTAYVADDSYVTPIRTATNTALRPINIRQMPAAIAITPD